MREFLFLYKSEHIDIEVVLMQRELIAIVDGDEQKNKKQKKTEAECWIKQKINRTIINRSGTELKQFGLIS